LINVKDIFTDLTLTFTRRYRGGTDPIQNRLLSVEAKQVRNILPLIAQ